MLQIQEPGLLTTVQDLGRRGSERFGVPGAGAVDAFALRAVNALVGNPPEAAGLEIGPGGLTFTASQSCLLAAAGGGAGLGVRVNGQPWPAWTALFLRAGQTAAVELPAGGWAYLGVRGGIDVPPVLGARATYLRAGLGGWHGRALRAGDALPIGPAPDRREALDLAGRHLPPNLRPAYGPAPTVGVCLGPQADWFTPEAREALTSAEFTVTTQSDRTGYRLSGPALAARQADLISEGMPLGSIQVPPGGAPIVMLADRPTIGGYPKIAVVARADLPLVAQCPPGPGRLRFRLETTASAQGRYRAQITALQRLAEAPAEPAVWGEAADAIP